MTHGFRSGSLRTVRVAWALVATAVPSSVLLAGGNAGPPQILERRSEVTGATDPVWVSADAATTPDGMIDWDLLGERAASIFHTVERQLPLPMELAHHMPYASGVFYEMKPDGSTVTWLRYGPATHEDPGGTLSSLEEVERRATGIYAGRVVGIEEGFLEGDVGTLLRLQTERVLLASEQRPATDELYLFWPEARFSIGEVNLWKSSPAYPSRPPIGSRILAVADQRVPLDVGRRLVLPRPEGILWSPRTAPSRSPTGRREARPRLTSLDGATSGWHRPGEGSLVHLIKHLQRLKRRGILESQNRLLSRFVAKVASQTEAFPYLRHLYIPHPVSTLGA